ncbi:MAG: hypothetical protein H5U06_11525 [Candidatus Aminicenantes bacterium]|nr:hypothetical protein [Candidatus Aminicenantes bacterium]
MMNTKPGTGNNLKLWIVLVPMIFLFLVANAGVSTQEFQNRVLKVDPFYLKLFDEGKLAFNRGDFEEAFQNFKIAAFGFLDEPDLLGEAFVYLTVSAYNLKRYDQVEHYLKEISRFKLNNRISSSNLPKELKETFNKIQANFKNGLTG